MEIIRALVKAVSCRGPSSIWLMTKRKQPKAYFNF